MKLYDENERMEGRGMTKGLAELDGLLVELSMATDALRVMASNNHSDIELLNNGIHAIVLLQDQKLKEFDSIISDIRKNDMAE